MRRLEPRDRPRYADRVRPLPYEEFQLTPLQIAEKLGCSMEEVYRRLATWELDAEMLGVPHLGVRLTDEEALEVYLVESGGVTPQDFLDGWTGGEIEDNGPNMGLYCSAQSLVDAGLGAGRAALAAPTQ